MEELNLEMTEEERIEQEIKQEVSIEDLKDFIEIIEVN